MSKLRGRLRQIFVDFSEYLNFLYSMVVKAKTMIQRSGSKREGDDLYIWPCRGLRVSAAFFLLFPAFILAFILQKKEDFCLWLATVVIPFGFLGMYPSQTM